MVLGICCNQNGLGLRFGLQGLDFDLRRFSHFGFSGQDFEQDIFCGGLCPVHGAAGGIDGHRRDHAKEHGKGQK